MSNINVQNYAHYAAKKQEEETLLENIRLKGLEKKNQSEALQKALREQKLQEEKHLEDIKLEYNKEFKALEKIAKSLNTTVTHLNKEQLKQRMSFLLPEESKLIAKILNENKLEDLKKIYQQIKLQENGIKQQFSQEFKLLEQIAKFFNKEVSQLGEQDVKKYLELKRKEQDFQPKRLNEQQKEEGSRITKGIERAAHKQEDLKEMLKDIKSKQLKVEQMSSETDKNKALETLNKQITKFEAKIQELKQELEKLQKELNTYSKDSEKRNIEQSKKDGIESAIKFLGAEIKELKQAFQKEEKSPIGDLSKGLKDEFLDELAKFSNDEKLVKLKQQIQAKKQLSSKILDSFSDLLKGEGVDEELLKFIQTYKTKVLTAELMGAEEFSAEDVNLLELEIEAEENRNYVLKDNNSFYKNHAKQSLKMLLVNNPQIRYKYYSVKRQMLIGQLAQTKNISLKVQNFIKIESDKLWLKENNAKLDEFNQNLASIKSLQGLDLDAELVEALKAAKQNLFSKMQIHQELGLQSEEQIKEIMELIKQDITLLSKLEKSLETKMEKPLLLRQVDNITDLDTQSLLKELINKLILKEELKNDLESNQKIIITSEKLEIIASLKSLELSKSDWQKLSQLLSKEVDSLQDQLFKYSEGLNKGSLADSTHKWEEVRAQVLEKFSQFKQGDEIKLIDLVKSFEGLSSEESVVNLILVLRQLYLANSIAFKPLIQQMLHEKVVDESFLENELGLLLGREENIAKSLIVSDEAIEIFKYLLRNLPPEVTQSEQFLSIIEKGRLDRKQLQALLKIKISKDAWDYGVLSFNSLNAGFLKERAELNSLLYFWKLMRKLAGDKNDPEELMNLFLAGEFGSYERDFFSFVVQEYQSDFIDPEHHFHDLYNLFLKDNVLIGLADYNREEVVLAVMLRFVIDLEAEDKWSFFRIIMENTKLEPSDNLFLKTVELIEFYFSNGLPIKEEQLADKANLQIVDGMTEWRDELLEEINELAVSKMVYGYKKPEVELPKVKLKGLSQRLKGKLKT